MKLGRLAAALGALAVVALVARFLGAGAQDEANRIDVDERDQLIELRSSAVAYRVLMGGMILVGFVMPFSASGWQLVHAAWGAIIVAEMVHYSLMVKAYRWGVRA